MTSAHLQAAATAFTKPRPEIRPGYTVRVHERISEGDKERIQVFEGLVISVHKGATPTDSTFTVRRIASGIGTEKIVALHSPKIEKIEVKKVAKVRRSKLFFLRGRRGKAARLSERFTTADEFAVATPEEIIVDETPADEVVETEDQVTDAPAAETEVAETDAVPEAEAQAADETPEEAPKADAPVEDSNDAKESDESNDEAQDEEKKDNE